MIISKEFTFEASHQLDKHQGKCSRLHGHSWKLCVAVEGQKLLVGGSPHGMIMDFVDLKVAVNPIIEALDHRHLGGGGIKPTVPGMHDDFYPTSECLIVWIAYQLQLLGLDWVCLVLKETCTSKTMLHKEEFERFALQEVICL